MSNDKPFVLVVEDEATQRLILTEYLSRHGLRVAAVANGTLMREALVTELPQIVLLDVGLPGEDGFALARWLRERHPGLGIIMVTGATDSVDRIVGLETGADDYVTKPFEMNELLARVRAAVRRGAVGSRDSVPHVVTTATFQVDLAAGVVTRDGAQVRLTPTEYHLLEILARQIGRLVPQQQLLKDVWGPGYEKEAHYLRVYLAQLRRKLERDPAHPVHLITEPGLGYRLDA